MATDFFYFLSTLPLLKLSGEGAPTAAEFLKNCRERLAPAEAALVERLRLVPPAAPEAADLKEPAVRGWYAWQTAMRNCIAARRARARKADAAAWRRQEDGDFTGDVKRLEALLEGAKDARERQEGWEALQWERLEALEGGEYFNFQLVVVYALKVLLLEERRGRSAAAGRARFEELVSAREEEAQGRRRAAE